MYYSIYKVIFLLLLLLLWLHVSQTKFQRLCRTTYHKMFRISRHALLSMLYKFPLSIDSCVRNLISHVLPHVCIINRNSYTFTYYQPSFQFVSNNLSNDIRGTCQNINISTLRTQTIFSN